MPFWAEKRAFVQSMSMSMLGDPNAFAEQRGMPPPTMFGETQQDSDEEYEFVPSPCVWVGSIPNSVSEEELRALFEKYGEIVNIRHFKLSKCAFVTFKKTIYAQASLELEGKDVGDSGGKLTLNIGKASRHLWIGNINDSVTESKLKSAFEEFGVIESVRILRKNSCGFVNFVSAMDAVRAAEALNDKEIEGQKIVVNFQWNESIRRTAKKGLDIKAKERMQNEVRRKFQEPSRQLFVGNLVPSVTESTLWTLFQKFGQVESIRAFINRGYAFVTYVDINSSVWVRNQMSSFPPTLGSRKLVVNFGKQPPDQYQDPNHTPRQQQQQQQHAPYPQQQAQQNVNMQNYIAQQNEMFLRQNPQFLQMAHAQPNFDAFSTEALQRQLAQGQLLQQQQQQNKAPLFYPNMNMIPNQNHMNQMPFLPQQQQQVHQQLTAMQQQQLAQLNQQQHVELQQQQQMAQFPFPLNVNVQPQSVPPNNDAVQQRIIEMANSINVEPQPQTSTSQVNEQALAALAAQLSLNPNSANVN